MKQKWPLFLFFFSISSTGYLHAQIGRDTTFSFYFGTREENTDTAQQKAFETFLKSIGTIKAIYGFADTTGSTAYNKKLSHRRAMQVHHLLPAAESSLITARGETDSLPQLWQNRRVDVVAVTTRRVQDFPVYQEGTLKEELNSDNILFLPDRPILTEASFGYVKALAQQLQSYSTEKFQIIGHVNYQSKLPADRLKELYELSEARAKTVYNMLIAYGIHASRITYKGVGNSQPVYPEPVNDEQKRANMRVQVLIVRN